MGLNQPDHVLPDEDRSRLCDVEIRDFALKIARTREPRWVDDLDAARKPFPHFAVAVGDRPQGLLSFWPFSRRPGRGVASAAGQPAAACCDVPFLRQAPAPP